MTRITNICLTALLLGATAITQCPAQESSQPWQSRYRPAVEQAKAEKKDIILIFTASEWVKICKIFESDILSQPEFLDQVTKKYVICKLEYPQNNRLPVEIAREYQLLKDAYRVRGYPSVVMTDSAGLPFGINGYQPTSADIYAKTLLTMLKAKEIRDAAIAKATPLKGIERAKALANAVPELPGNLGARYYRKVMEELIANDPQNKTGKAEIFKKQIADVKYSSEMQKLAADVQYGKMLELTDSYIKENDLTGNQRQKALLNKIGIQKKQKNTAGVVQTLLEIVTVNPKSQFGKSAQKMLDNLRAQKIEETLER